MLRCDGFDTDRQLRTGFLDVAIPLGISFVVGVVGRQLRTGFLDVAIAYIATPNWVIVYAMNCERVNLKLNKHLLVKDQIRTKRIRLKTCILRVGAFFCQPLNLL